MALLGGFAVVVDRKPVEPAAWKSRRSAQLVALLALTPNHRLTTEQAMDALWPDLSPEAARANLHKTATLARQAMGSKESVVVRADVVSLWPAGEPSVDAEEFEAGARRALASGDPAQCATAARAFTGELLPEERYEEWTIGPRERLQRLHLDLLRAAGQWAELADADPTDEAAHRELMEEHFRAGRLHAAIRQFQRLRTILARDLGVLPSPATVALYRRVLGTASAGWVRPGLVGREDELLEARAALRRAAEGRPAAVFVTGDAGVGKTRVCEELVEQATGDGWVVLRAAGREQTASVPYWALVEAIQALMVERPYLANALGDAERSVLTRLTGSAPDHQAGAIQRHAVLHLLSGVVLAAGAPMTMLFVDDLDHADDDTLALADVLASAPGPRNVVLVASYREGSDERVATLARSMVARGIGVEVALRTLSRDETDAMVQGLVGRPASPAELDLVWHLSEGNPFFALEVATALTSEQAATRTGANWAVDVRLERLPADTLAALRSVAIVEQEFTADELAALAGIDGDGALEHLDAGLAAGVLAQRGSSYRFRHDLVRQRMVETVGEAERAAAHARAGECLAGLGAPPARVVHHLLAAGREQDALPWLRRAAMEAIAVGAHADALLAANRALEIAPGDPPSLALRADAMSALGDPGAPAAYALAVARSPESERPAVSVRRAKALAMAGDIPTAIEALSTLGAVPDPVRGQLLFTRGLVSWCVGALDEAEAIGQEAKRLAEETRGLRDFVEATMLLAMVAHQRGVWPQRLSLDLLDPNLRPDLAAVVMDAHLCVAESYLYGGVPYPEIVRFAHALQGEAARAGASRAEAFATTVLGEALLLMGDTAAAASHLRSAVGQHQRVGVLCGEALSFQRLAQALAAEGDRAGAQSALAGALHAARGSPIGVRHLLDRIHGTAVATAPDSPTALAAVDEAARAVRGPHETCAPCSITFTVPAAIACAGAGDLPPARMYLAHAEQVAGAFFPQGGWQAGLQEARGHIALAEGDVEAGVRLLTAARDTFELVGQELDAARCRRRIEPLISAGKV